MSPAASAPVAPRPSVTFAVRARSTSDQGPTFRAPAPVSTSRRGVRRGAQDTGIVLRGGRQHHEYDARVAPYPISYDREIIDLDTLEHLYVTRSRGSITCFDFRDSPPARSLDLGCGNGAWVVDAAKTWKNCHLVGFDLVRLQPQPRLLPRDVAGRIRWVQGNFLTEKLPFEDNYFDHVRIYRIAWGVGEMQWDGIFAEIARVLRPGGALEMVEEDILFPILPRSYTIKAKRPRPSAPYPRPSLTLSPPPSPMDETPSSTIHPHALLESLFLGLFETRTINLRPTAIVPHHLNIHFRNVLTSASLEYPFPPPPLARQQLRRSPSDATARATRERASQSVSSFSTVDSASSGDAPRQQRTPPTTNASLPSLSAPPPPAPIARPFVPVKGLIGSFKVTDPTSVPLLPPVPVDVNDRNLALQLTVVFQRILACKEAMWEELSERIAMRRSGGPDLLRGLGWDDEPDTEGESSDSGQADGQGQGDGAAWGEAKEAERARARFEELTARFERDMRYRTALPDALHTTLGWSRPASSPMNKHELARETEMEQAIADAARGEAADGEQAPQPLRSFKAFVGFKEGKR